MDLLRILEPGVKNPQKILKSSTQDPMLLLWLFTWAGILQRDLKGSLGGF